MTRLQKMLSQIKTVEELAEILGTSTDAITSAVGVTKDSVHLIRCIFGNCEKCGFRSKTRACNNERVLTYLNTEIPEPVYTDTDSVKTTSDHAPIIKLRDSARKLIKTVTLEGFKQGHSAITVYHHIDEYIDVLEGIGLFEENELRAYVATDLTKVLLNKKYGDSTK